jgi:hypothetical protein
MKEGDLNAKKLFTLIMLLFTLVSCAHTPTALPTPTITSTPTVGITPTATSTMLLVKNTPSPTSIPKSRSDCNALTIEWKATPAPEGSEDKYFASIPVAEVNTLTPEEIAFALCCQYLEKFTSPSVEISRRLDDFRLRVTRYKQMGNEAHIVVGTMFEVLPPDLSNNYWGAGACGDLDNGWIICGAYATILIEDGNYVISGFWNG